MPAYGIRLRDTSGNSTTLKPEALTIISAGRVTLPSVLNGDGTYGTDINLPTSNIPTANIAVIVTPVSCVNNVVYTRYINSGTLYYNTFYADSTKTYYTRNDSTGVMTTWSAGNRTANSKSTWNPILSIYPIAFWDKMGQTSFSKIRLFAATVYLLRITYNDTNYSLAGSVSGNANWYYPTETLANINDNDEGSYVGADATVGSLEGSGTQRDFLSTISISFSSILITKAEICMSLEANYNSGGSASGYCKVDLYYAGDWHEVISQSWSGIHTPYETYTWTIQGRWIGVTGIRCRMYVYAKKGSGTTSAYSTGVTRELRAYGDNVSDDTANKLVYSIGSVGVPSVDYLIAVKNYNY